MNGLRSSGAGLVQVIDDELRSRNYHGTVAICPPAPLYHMVSNVIEGGTIMLGAQDCHYAPSGAYTGDISAEMLKDAGCKVVILGHSERRDNHHETNAMVKVKAKAALANDLMPIICVGESVEERNHGKTMQVIEAQVKESLPENANMDNTVIAYEPKWAIGSGKTPTQSEIKEVHQAISTIALGFSVLYGGSVKANNAKELIHIPGVSGLLVGGASIDAREFVRIIRETINLAKEN